MGVIQSLWYGDDLSNMEIISIKSFLEHGHTYHLYTYNDINNMPDGVIVKDGNDILPEDNICFYQSGPGKGSVSLFSNYFRFELLKKYGGWWADTDVVCLKPLDFDTECVIASAVVKPDGKVGMASAIIKSPPDGFMVSRCLEIINSKDKDKVKWGQVAARPMERVVRNNKDSIGQYVVPPEALHPIPWFEFWKVIAPESPNLKGSYAVHLSNELWRRNDLDKNGDYPKNSLYEQWKGKYL